MFEAIKRIFRGTRGTRGTKGHGDYVRGFQAALATRLTNDWLTSSASADQELRNSLNVIRNRAREMSQNNDYARQFLRLAVKNIAGSSGFVLQVRAKDSNGQFDLMANKMIEDAFADWSRPENCTVTGKISFRKLQELIVATVARDGEIFIRKVRGGKYKYGFALQVIEPEFIDVDHNETLKNGNVVRLGIELDKWRKPVAYHVTEPTPESELYSVSKVTGETRRIPAEEIIHIYDIDRGNQTRGVSWLVTSMYRLRMLTGFEEASLVNARASAAKMGFFKSQTGAEYTGETKDDYGNTITNAEPGTFEMLPPGMDFMPYDPKFPSDQHDMFVKAILRGIASGLGVSYNTIANDLEGVNYSSIRAGLLDERDTWKSLQELFVEQFLQPVYASWLEMALTTGAISLPLAKFDKFNAAHWQGRRWQWVDPLKDVQANIEAVRAGFKTSAQVIAEQGGDIYDMFEQLQLENKLREQYGIGKLKDDTDKSDGSDDEGADDPEGDVRPGRKNTGTFPVIRSAV